MKVLVSAYACAPVRGSEHGTGWAWAKAIARHNETWVLTRGSKRDAIEAAMAGEPDLRINFVYLDLPARARRWKRGRSGVHLYYFLWQILAWRTARRLHKEIEFDVAHHLTFAVDWMPAGVAWVRGLPTVWGPVGGTTSTPPQLWRWLGPRGWFAELMKEAACRPARRLFGDATARRAALVVAQNDDVAKRFSSSRTVVEPNVAIDCTDVLDATSTRDRAQPRLAGERRAIFAGRLVPLKGLRLAVATMSEPAAGEWVLDVYGDGPERTSAASRAQRLGLDNRVRFHGTQPRDELLRQLATADVLFLPSFHDAGGWVVAEALEVGCPVLCLDLGGPPNLIGDSGGVAISPGDDDLPHTLARALSDAAECTPARHRWMADRIPELTDEWYASVAPAKVSR